MIQATDFVRRFEALVAGGMGPGLPRRMQDKHILLKAVSLGIRRELPCSERDLGLALTSWLRRVGPRVDIDRVSLRRALVDFGYLRRDSAGRAYELPDTDVVAFTPEVEALDPQHLLAGLRQRLLSKAGKQPRPESPGQENRRDGI